MPRHSFFQQKRKLPKLTTPGFDDRAVIQGSRRGQAGTNCVFLLSVCIKAVKKFLAAPGLFWDLRVRSRSRQAPSPPPVVPNLKRSLLDVPPRIPKKVWVPGHSRDPPPRVLKKNPDVDVRDLPMCHAFTISSHKVRLCFF